MRTGMSPEGLDVRPPIAMAASAGDTPVRPSARKRPIVPVRLDDRPGEFSATDPYVRRFWVAALGAEAVAELLRLVRAAEKGEGVRLPRYLPALLRAGLVRANSEGLVVSKRVPAVPREMQWRFPPSLAAEHSRWVRLPSNRQQPH